MRPLLLNPGPVTLSARVRQAMAEGDACHREPGFAELTRRVLTALAKVYDGADDYDAVLLAGSGTCAVEAMLATLAPDDARTLVTSNGVYGERMAAMLEAHGKPFDHQVGGWLDGLDLDGVERRLRRDPAITHVAAVHHETTTGRLNDIEGLAAICRGHGRRLFLDAVSSFGAEEIRYADWNLEALAASANKCLHAPPGAAFVIGRGATLDGGAASTRSVYLDLRRYHATQQASGYSPFTPAVHGIAALAQALAELRESGGWRARRESYRVRTARIAGVLHRLGVADLIPAAESSSVLRAYRLPAGVDYRSLHDALAEEQIVIYAGQGELGREIFRIACMGEIDQADLDRLDAALVRCLSPAGAGA